WGEVTLMAGLPGSGKDTWIAQHGPDVPVISLDAIRQELALGQGAAAANTGLDRAREFLRRRQPFVWNATSLKRDLRAGVISTCLRYGARVRIVYLEAGPGALRARNDGRPESERVPESVL